MPTHLRFDNARAVLRDASGEPPATDLGLDLAALAERELRASPTTEAELEAAINHVEDRLSEHLEWRRREADLVVDDPRTCAFLRAAVGADAFPIGALEDAFTRISLEALRHRPEAPEDYLRLLVVREILHHLGHARVVLAAAPPEDAPR